MTNQNIDGIGGTENVEVFNDIDTGEGNFFFWLGDGSEFELLTEEDFNERAGIEQEPGA